MGFSNTFGLLALLGIPIIILMYIMKQKYKEHTVPSLFLWEKTDALTKAEKPFQKLKKNLLLFLQILAVILIALILSRPYISSTAEGGKYIIVLDASLSMQTVQDNQTRFDKAKKDAVDFVENSGKSSEFSVIIMDSRPYIAQDFDGDVQKTVGVIDSTKVTYSNADTQGVKTLIDGIITDDTAGVFVFTDSGFGSSAYNVINEGTQTANTAITSMSHITNESTEIMVKVKNFGTANVEKTVTLYGDGEIIDLQEGIITGEKTTDFYFTITNEYNSFKAVITPNDALEADDSRYYVINNGSENKVLLISEGNIFIEKALDLFPSLTVYKGDIDNIENLQGCDLYIFDGVLPEEMPADGYIMAINPPEGNSFIEVNGEIAPTGQFNSEDEILNYISDMDFGVVKAKSITMPQWRRSVVSADEIPLVIKGENNGVKSLVFAFDLYQSDLPLKKEYPILMYNIMEWFFGSNIAGGEIQAGTDVDFSPNPGDAYAAVIDVDGNETQLAPPFPAEIFTETNTPGIYKFVEKSQAGDAKEALFAVNCGGVEESDLSNVSESTSEQSETKTQRPFNKSMAGIIGILLLALLAWEWWVSVK